MLIYRLYSVSSFFDKLLLPSDELFGLPPVGYGCESRLGHPFMRYKSWVKNLAKNYPLPIEFLELHSLFQSTRCGSNNFIP